MFFWRMINRALRRQVNKRLMIALTILLGSGLTTSMFAVMMDVSDKVQSELSSFGANIQIVPQGASIVSDMYDVDAPTTQGAIREDELGNLKTIFWGHNIEDFTPFLTTSASVDNQDVTVVGTWFNHFLATKTGEEVETGIKHMRDWWDVTGSWATDDQAMAGSRLASANGWEAGDTITVSADGQAYDVTIAGIIQAGSDEDRQLFVPLDMAQSIAGRDGDVEKVEVRAITTPDNDLARRAARDPSTLSLSEWETWYCTAYVSSIAYQIEETMTNVDASAVRQVADTEGEILGKTQLIMTVVAVFAMVAASLGIANLVTASVMERSKEVGLMKALGARNKNVVATILTETFVVALIGGVLGFFAGVGLAQIVGHLVFGSGITIRPMLIPVMILIIFVTVILGCLPSMRYLLKLKPAQVLHGR
ncbi:ABC transporter permease [Ancrocorticia populi]|uniref:ABC transporter permease n=1 Tax=Ancrocorticia populi TaxID=2175228 RepID=A0A2V1K5C0_9ACTO|nr:ABC transporter permease [Ancrocorticia populi]PWF25770.1 ABC transporter permease [Ancrocorticia populi]